MNAEMQDDGTDLSRRRMVALGALGGATLLGGGAAGTFSADRAQAAEEDQSKVSYGDPGGTRIGSALVGGYSYIYRQYYDFAPVDNTPVTYLDGGVFSTTDPKLYTAVELPFGALLWNIEFYVQTTVDVTLEASLWRTQTAATTPLTLAKVASKSSGVAAYGIGVPDTKRGPYAPGSMLVVGVNNTSASTRWNGVRIGYSREPAGVVLLDKPVRVYDTRTSGSGKIGNGQTRIHTLATHIPVGAVSAILNVSVTGGEKAGGLAVYNAGTTAPGGSALYWTSATVSTELHSKLTSDRKIKATMRGVVGAKCHYFIDVVGYAL